MRILLLILLLAPALAAQTVTFTDGGLQPPTGNVAQGQSDYVALGWAQYRGITDPSTTMTQCTIANVAAVNAAGASDTVQIRLMRDNDQNGAVSAGDTTVATQATPTFPVSFTGLSESVPIPSMTIAPYLVVVDVNGGATAGNVYQLQLQSVTLSAGASTGLPINGNVHTIVAPSTAEIDIQRGASIASGATDNVGNQAPSVTFTLTYTITNSGSQNLDLTGSPLVDIPSLSVQNCTAVVTQQPTTPVVPSGSTTFSIDVQPGAAAPQFGFGIYIQNNDSDENPYTIIVVGDAAASTATQLVVVTQPAGAVPGTPFATQPVIEVRDASNALVANDSTTQVTVSITPLTGTAGAVLSGTLTVQAVGGVVTFSGLSIDLAGTGYTLDFSDSGSLTDAASSPFDVTTGGGGGGSGGGGSDGGGGCVAGTDAEHAWLTLLALIAAIGVLTRTRTAQD